VTLGLTREASQTPRTIEAPGVAGDRGSAIGSLMLWTLLASMVAGRFETALASVAVAAAAAVAAGAPWPRRRWFTNLAVGGGLAVVLNLYLVRGSALPLPRILGQPATLEGLKHGVLLVLRLLGAGIAVHGLAAAWPGERAADELENRLGPLERVGLPVSDSRAMIGLALRFGPLLAREYDRIARLQDMRAGRPPRGLLERLERRRAAAIPAIVSAIEHAERVALALEARHYGRRRSSRVARAGGTRRLGGGALALNRLKLVLAGVALS